MKHLSLAHKKQAKLKHIDACKLSLSQYEKTTGLALVELEHHAACALSLADVSLETSFLGAKLKTPLMIAPMTGGMEQGLLLNRLWAKASEHFGLSFGVGSQRLALEDERVKQSFMVRKFAPTTFLYANLGAAQLCEPRGIDNALLAVQMIEANALFIHLNPLQEACKARGDHDFHNLLEALKRLVERCQRKNIPILVREVGFGLSKASAKALINTGINGLDCSGAGGTSWSKVEALCSNDERYQKLGAVFGEWGIPTRESIANVRAVDKNIPLIASGGIRNGLDVAKALALGANIAAMAQPMLMAADKGEESLHEFIEQTLLELRVALYANGAKNIHELKIKAH